MQWPFDIAVVFATELGVGLLHWNNGVFQVDQLFYTDAVCVSFIVAKCIMPRARH